MIKTHLLTKCLPAEIARESVILVVSPDVSLHVTLLRETLPTDIASERLFLRMNTSLMSPEIASLSESFTTMTTVKVLLSSMYLHVSVHVSFLSKTLPADLSVGHHDDVDTVGNKTSMFQEEKGKRKPSIVLPICVYSEISSRLGKFIRVVVLLPQNHRNNRKQNEQKEKRKEEQKFFSLQETTSRKYSRSIT